jgi:hypothetical protein
MKLLKTEEYANNAQIKMNTYCYQLCTDIK